MNGRGKCLNGYMAVPLECLTGYIYYWFYSDKINGVVIGYFTRRLTDWQRYSTHKQANYRPIYLAPTTHYWIAGLTMHGGLFDSLTDWQLDPLHMEISYRYFQMANCTHSPHFWYPSCPRAHFAPKTRCGWCWLALHEFVKRERPTKHLRAKHQRGSFS